MFNERLNKLLTKENPVNKFGKEDFDNEPIEVMIVEQGGNVEEVPDFFKMFEEKSLTKDEDCDTMEDPTVEIEALKKLIKKLKSEK